MSRVFIPAICRSGARSANNCGGSKRSTSPSRSRRAFRPLPRPAAALARELTLPEVAQSVVLTRTPGRASSRCPKPKALTAFAATRATLAIHLSIHALDNTVAELVPAYGEGCPVAVVFRASWPDERIIRATLGTIVGEVEKTNIDRTALIIVGEVLAARDFRDSALYDSAYQRRFRGRGS